MHPILTALGVSKIPVGTAENDILKKVLNDHLFAQRAQELMIQHFGETVARQMHPVEVAALLKRVGAVAPPPPTVKWEFMDMDEQLGSGVYAYFMKATLGPEVRNFPGPQPWVKHEKNAQGKTFDTLMPVTKETVRQSIEKIKWETGTTVFRPPQELLWAFENRALATVRP